MPIGTSAGAFYATEEERDIDWSTPSNMPIISPDEVMSKSDQLINPPEKPVPMEKLPTLEELDLKLLDDESYFKSLTPNDPES